jgi:chromosome segregation ATPase
MVRRRKQSSGNLMPLSVPNPTLLTFLGTSQPGSDAKRVTFNEMNAVSNDDILKRLLALETKVDSIGTTTGTTDVSALNDKIDKLELSLKQINESIKNNNQRQSITFDGFTTNIEDLWKNIEEIEKKLEPVKTTAGKYDSQIQHLIGGTWY